jgi:hypothetical protein
VWQRTPRLLFLHRHGCAPVGTGGHPCKWVRRLTSPCCLLVVPCPVGSQVALATVNNKTVPNGLPLLAPKRGEGDR